MKNILIISFNSGGTMGHGKIITSLANFLSKKNKNVTILSDMSFSRNFNIKNKVNVQKLKDIPHINYTIGGMCDCGQRDEIFRFAMERDVECVVFSTFFDLDLVKKFKSKKIKTILLSYPIRDTYRLSLKQNRAYAVFDKVITLYGLEFKDAKMQNEILVNPLKIAKVKEKNHPYNDILVTCGGGGRPSSKIFLKKVISALKKIIKKNRKLKVIIIRGNSRSNLSLENVKTIIWTKDFGDLLFSSKVIISEAGYYTMLDLINHNKKAILIPGERIIDNQEIRALKLGEIGAGKVFFPFEKTSKLIRFIKEDLDERNDDNIMFKDISNEFTKYEELGSVFLRELK